LRGEGNAQFIYARSSKRAVEICKGNSGFVVELWAVADEESDEPSVRVLDLASSTEALKEVVAWLK
jgi:hypothetical protein